MGLRFHSIAQSLGTSFSWYVSTADMPDAPNERGNEVFEDLIETPSGNTFIYSKGRRKSWKMDFVAISTDAKDKLEHVVSGWYNQKQITAVAYGSSVIGTLESMGSMNSVGQIWGTGYVRWSGGLPKETAYDMWNCSIQITEFGPDQSFT